MTQYKGFMKFWRWTIFHTKESDFKKFIWVFTLARILALIIAIPISIKFIPFSSFICKWWEWMIIPFVFYISLRLYWEWIKAIWKFLKEDIIVHYIFLILIPIGIIVGGYHLFLGDLSIPCLGISGTIVQESTISNKKQSDIKVEDGNNVILGYAGSLNENRLTVEKLNGFYASIFTAIAVIGAIAGLSGWRKIKESMEQVKIIKEIKDDIEFIHEKREHTEWIEKKFKDISNQNLESLDLSSSDDRNKLEKIKKYVTKDVSDSSWLELIYAYNLIDKKCSDFIIREQNLDQAQKILEYLDYRIIPDKSYLETQMRHIKGQVYWNKYLQYSNKYNFFMSDPDDFEKYKSDEVEKARVQALECLEKAADSYKVLLDNENDYRRSNMNIDEAKGNYAMIFIELYKYLSTKNYCKVFGDVFSRILENHQIRSYKPTDELTVKIEDLVEYWFSKITHKTFNHQWDLARIRYYKWIFRERNLKSKGDFKQFKITKDDIDKIEKKHLIDMRHSICPSEKINEKLFRYQIEKEQKEFQGKGFPGHPTIVKDLEDEVKKVV